MPATASIQAYVRATLTGAGGLASAQAEYIINLAAALASGTLDTQLDKAWGKTATITGNDDIDLNGSAVKDDLGNNLAFLDVCGVIVSNDPASTGNLLVGAATGSTAILGVGAATHQRVVKPGGFDFWFSPAGFPVAAGTSDILRIGVSAGSVTYSIIVLGRSA